MIHLLGPVRLDVEEIGRKEEMSAFRKLEDARTRRLDTLGSRQDDWLTNELMHSSSWPERERGVGDGQGGGQTASNISRATTISVASAKNGTKN